MKSININMNIKSSLVLAVVMVLGITTLKGQQIPLSNMYTSNNYLLNPAYAGQKQCGEAYFTHRRQWVGIANAPVTSFVSGNVYLGKNMGVGLKLYNDKASFLQQNYGMLSFAYHLPVGATSKLSFGLSAGMFGNSIDQTQITANDMTDDLFTGGNYKPTVETDFGLAFRSEKLNIGVSVPRFIETTSKFNSPIDQGVFTLRRHAMFYGAYDIATGENSLIRPSVMTRWVPGIDFQYDINADFVAKDKFSAGVGYREQEGLVARIGLMVSKMTVNYAYEFFGGGITSRSAGSHEIRIGFKFCKSASAPDTTSKADPYSLQIKNDDGNEQFTFKTLKAMDKYIDGLNDAILADRIRKEMEKNPEDQRFVVDNQSLILQIQKDDGKKDYKFRTLEEMEAFAIKMDSEDPILAARIRAAMNGADDDDRKFTVDDRSIIVKVKTDKEEKEYKFRTLEQMEEYVAQLEKEDPKLAAILRAQMQQDPDSKLYSAITYTPDEKVEETTPKEDVLTKSEIETLQKTIRFGKNQSNALDQSKPLLNEAIAIMKRHPSLKLELDGYTCNIGEEVVNKELSRERAEYVADYFRKNGISSNRITTKGYGSSSPKVPNTSESNRAQNRRVEFKVLEK